VEEGNEVKDRVLETVGFQGANPICDDEVRTEQIPFATGEGGCNLKSNTQIITEL
jgi:hypothetical protein